MHRFQRLIFLLLAHAACVPTRAQDPLSFIQKDTFLQRVLQSPQNEVQLRYTRIVRDANNKPQFTTYTWPQKGKPTYFYPASTVKIMLSALALEKIHRLNKQYNTQITRETAYRNFSVPGYGVHLLDSTAQNGLPSIAQDIRLILTVSDNAAFNRLCDFVYLDATAKLLHQKGYCQTDIVHRLGASGIDNRNHPELQFYDSTRLLLHLPWYRTVIPSSKARKMKGHIKGSGYYLGDSLIMQPFDMGAKNRFGLEDMEHTLKAILMPETLPKKQQFDLQQDDYAFLRYWMSIYPRESQFPTFSSNEYYDGYCKFLLYGDDTIQRPPYPRSFNKVGDAYGSLSDMAYIFDPDSGVEFLLCVNILCNSDGIFNDDNYDYDSIGFPFLAALGRKILDYEQAHPHARKPDLSRFRINYSRRL